MLKRLLKGFTHRDDTEANAENDGVPVAKPVKPGPVTAKAQQKPAELKAVAGAAGEHGLAEPGAKAATEDAVCPSQLIPDCSSMVDLEIAPDDHGIDHEAAVELLASFHNDLEHDRFRLSSLPDTALRIRQLLNDPDIQVSKLADVISLDPAIATKLTRVSNSALYASTSRSDTIQGSVLRLGLDMTRQIVMSFALKDLMSQCPAQLQQFINDFWEHSVRVSSIAYVLAKRTRVCAPEEALLAGILSNVGFFSVFNYLDNYPDIAEEPERLAAVVSSMQAEVGALVLEKWEFSAELVDCARHCEDWHRELEPGACADLCDLVIVAALHAHIGRKRLPPFEKIPSFTRISGGVMSAESAVEFMRDAEEEIEQTRSLFYGS